MPLRCVDYFEALEEEQIRGEASLNFLYLLKDRKSQRHINVISPLPKSFINQGGLTHHKRRE